MDEFVSDAFGISRSQVKKLIADGVVLVNSELPSKAGCKLKTGDSVEVELFVPENPTVNKDLPRPQVIFENDSFIVVNKPAGVVTHCDTNHKTDAMTLRLLNSTSLSSIGAPLRPGVVHRLDKDTSGVMAFAKTDAAHRTFEQLFATRKVAKTYLALCHGSHLPQIGTIDSPIIRDTRDRKKMTVSANLKARNAVSHFEVLEQLGNGIALVKVDIETGRTHQIRVHLAALNAPVLGDDLYSNQKLDEKIRHIAKKNWRLFLHSHRLAFAFNCINEQEFIVEMPDQFSKSITALKSSK